jgi:L-ascorbate metabolism protein UlaG (beta-lactamase superfamily)
MKPNYFLSAILALIVSFTLAENPDQIKTNKGSLEIQPISHATLTMMWDNKTIYVDPVGGATAFSEFPSPDIILITDIHGDHLQLETLQELPIENTTFVVPEAVADQLPKDLGKKIIILKNGDKTNLGDITIEAVPMYNLPGSSSSFHQKGRGNGYVLTMGGKKIYLSGDTEDIPEMRALKNIDVAFVCMNLPYTMDVDHAASAVLEFKPKIVYPYHYRGQGGLSDVEKFKSLVSEGNPDIEVRLRQWYPE